MFWRRKMAAASRVTQVAGNTLATMEDFYGPVGEARINNLSDQTERHRIPAAIHIDMIIGPNTGTFPKRKDIGICWQWLQVRAIERRKQICTACRIVAHDTHVQCVQQRPDRGIQLCQREEPVIAQPCEDPALGKARALHEGDADDLERMAAPVRAAHPEIAPAVAAANTFLGAIDAVRRDTAALARSTLSERAEAMAEIEQERIAARADIAEQRAKLAREKAVLDEKKADVALKWAAADRLLQLLQPLIEKMTSWLGHAGLPAELADEGEDILRETREVISTSKPGGEGQEPDATPRIWPPMSARA